MSGEFEAGDLIIVKEVKSKEELKIGDVISYKLTEKTLVTHRIIDIINENDVTKYTTKGDANNTQDKENVEFANVKGKYVYKMPLMGRIINLIQKPDGMLIVFAIPTALIFSYILKQQKREKKKSQRREKRLQYEISKKSKRMENEQC